MFWNQRFEYHMGLRLSRDYGISTLNERGMFILELARRKYREEGKRAGLPAQELAHIAIDEAVKALYKLEDPNAPERDLRPAIDQELDNLLTP